LRHDLHNGILSFMSIKQKNRINLSEVRQKLVGYFSLRKEILFAYIFGSQISGKSNKLSDIDIAVFINRKLVEEKSYRYGYQAEILSELMRHLKTERIDLVLLNNAPPLLKHRVIYYGELIYCVDESERINFQVDTINRYMDYKFLQRKIS